MNKISGLFVMEGFDCIKFISFRSCDYEMMSQLKIVTCYSDFITKPTVFSWDDTGRPSARLQYIGFFVSWSSNSGVGSNLQIHNCYRAFVIKRVDLKLHKLTQDGSLYECSVLSFSNAGHVTRKWDQILICQ